MTLKRYLTEAELAAVQPVTGDEFDINLREITNIETVVVEHTDGAIMIELDDAAIAMLEEHGVVFEDDEQLNEFWPLVGAIAGRVAGGMAGRALAGTAGRAVGSAAGSMLGKSLGSKISGNDQEQSNNSPDAYNIGKQIALADEHTDEYMPEEGDIVRINYNTEHSGQLGQVVELAPSGKFAYVEFKDGAIESYDASNLEKVSDEEADAYLDQEEDDFEESMNDIKRLAGMATNEAGAFSYGKKPPRKGSWNDRIAKKSKEHQDKQPDYKIKDDMIGAAKTKKDDTNEAADNYDKSHGGPYDRGSADAYYGRPGRPHKMVPAKDGVKGQMERVTLTDPEEIAAYNAGYAEEDDRKDYGESVELDEGDIDYSRNLASKSDGDLNAVYAIHKNQYRIAKLSNKSGLMYHHKLAMDTIDAERKRRGMKTEEVELDEAEYRGRKVQLGKPMQGDVKKFKVYVKDPKTGNVKKVNFGDPNMRIKKSNPARRKSFRARHNCANPGPRTKARYWSCRKW